MITKNSFNSAVCCSITARRFSSMIAASLIATMLAFGVSGSAVAQSTEELLKQKYDILQQQADAETKKAETERMRQATASSRNTAQSNSSGSSQNWVVADGVDSLEGLDVPTYRLGNGVILKVTGIFWPDSPTECIAHCP